MWVQLGNVLKEAGDFVGAKQAYEQALELNPQDADLQVQFGHLYTTSGDATKAQRYYETAVKFGSTDELAQRHASSVLPGRAIASPSQRELSQDVPRHSATETFRVADSLRDRQQWADAAAAYAQGLALDPDAFGMWVQMGHVLKEAGRPREAETAYSHALRLNPGDRDLLLQMGHLFALVHNPTKACLFYAQSISLGSRDEHAVLFLARHPGHDTLVRETVARLLPEAKRWKASGTEMISNNFTRFILDAAT